MDSSAGKNQKEKMNETLQSSETAEDHPSYKSLEHVESFEHIKSIFNKTEAMREVAKEKNHRLQGQFQDLKERLSSSSEYLLRIKKNIENLKFSYQKNIIEVEKHLDPATEAGKFESEDMAAHMEGIRRKIDELHDKMAQQRDKQLSVTESYQEAFNKVVSTLQEIESGAYSSRSLGVVQD